MWMGLHWPRRPMASLVWVLFPKEGGVARFHGGDRISVHSVTAAGQGRLGLFARLRRAHHYIPRRLLLRPPISPIRDRVRDQYASWCKLVNRLHSDPYEADIEIIMKAKIVDLAEVKKTP